MPTIQDGREAIEQGNMQQARLIFEAILQEDKRDQEAWLGLAEVLTNVEDKRICYENVLKIDKNNRAAKEGLRNLEPQENPFVAALQPTDEEADDDEDADASEDGADETIVSQRLSDVTGSEAALEPANEQNTPLLVALGLILSVVVFALGSGMIYALITSIVG